MWIIKIFRYVEPLWIGDDKKISIRRFLSLVFSLDFVSNMNHAFFTWEVGKSYADAGLLVGIEAGLITALLSLTTYSSTVMTKELGPPPTGG